MTGFDKFDGQWEPHLLDEQVLADGTWWYDGQVPYSVVLKRQRFDYSSDDLSHLESHLDPVTLDYIDYAINSTGEVFIWFFSGPSGRSQSPSFSTLAEARAHIESYARVEVRWLAEGAA